QISRQTTLNSSSVDQLNLRLVRASQYIQQFRIICHHKPGKNNLIADALSRLPTKNMDPSADSDLDALCADPEPNGNAASDPPNAGEPVLATVELSPEFMRRVIAGYATDTKARLIMATLRETSEEGRDARMPYYIDNNLLYQRQVTPDGENGRLYIPRALAHDVFNNIHD